MDTVGTLFDLPHMIDIACGSPQSGVINFNALHALLHVIVQQMRLESKRVEYLGSVNDGLAKSMSTPLFEVTEFATQIDGTGNFSHRVKKDKPPVPKVDTIIVVKKKLPKEKKEPSKEKDSKERDSKERDSKEKKGFPLQPIEVPSNEDFRNIDGVDSSIEDDIAPILPKSSELLPKLGDVEQSPVNDMWNMLNVTKRLDAAEMTIQKLISMLGEMGKEYNRVNSMVEIQAKSNDLVDIKDKLDDIQQKMHSAAALHAESEPIYEFVSVGTTKTTKPEPKIIVPRTVSLTKFPANKDELESLKSDLDYLKMAVQRIAMCSGLKDISNYLTKDLKTIACPGVAEGVDNAADNISKYKDDEDDAKLIALEKNFEMMERRMITADKRVYDLEKEFGEIGDRIEDVLQSVEATANQDHDTANLYAMINELKTKSNHTSERCNSLMQARDTMLNTLEEQLNKLTLLDDAKIDREEVDELLAEKADYNLVQRKVSTDHFDATKRELGNGLLEAQTKMAEYEELIQQDLETIRGDLTEKTTRSDLNELRDYIMGKLQTMQDRMKAMTVARRDPEAAATKTKFLRDVQCLSCEQNVIMRKEEPATVPKADPMVPMKSLRPQLTYDLDNIRRELNQTGTSRNMHHFELMYRNASGAQRMDTKHPCNRYCGGSHTAINAHENFQRRNLPKPKGCFKPAEENLVRGNDGAVYKGAPFEPCICGDGPLLPVYASPKSTPRVTETSKLYTSPADLSEAPSNRPVSIVAPTDKFPSTLSKTRSVSIANTTAPSTSKSQSNSRAASDAEHMSKSQANSRAASETLMAPADQIRQSHANSRAASETLMAPAEEMPINKSYSRAPSEAMMRAPAEEMPKNKSNSQAPSEAMMAPTEEKAKSKSNSRAASEAMMAPAEEKAKSKSNSRAASEGMMAPATDLPSTQPNSRKVSISVAPADELQVPTSAATDSVILNEHEEL